MSSIVKKAERMLQIEQLLLSYPRGLTAAEIARRLGVHRSTIGRYFPDLPKHIYIDEEDGGRWKVDRTAYLLSLRLTLNEAMAVHLATRLLATRLERQNPHAASALRKLATALERLAPRISAHLYLSADDMDDSRRYQDPNFIRSLEVLTLAWAEQREVRVWYRKKGGQIGEYLFSPYYIEPYAVGQAVHTIGYCEPPGALRTFKVERIERIELTAQYYTIPADFDVRELLRHAWGIWYTDAEPVEVVLKFQPRVARRVGETRWHRTEQVSVLEDGSLLWRAQIAEPTEMLPWIRGWGADVEVLAPDWLRERMKEETEKLHHLYCED
ncbi:MAG: WYL domain-containing protein [Anaerolineales bacterium]|nr:WYL domain-containing protein [Anaerolineales bacterium]MCS7249057.1 WYL domain-containing protein [Anaerolineales bacterium]MDW8162870.1 WYL domain-containing protein [Anaerolineales bacterium]MDW8446843.1 WYL domain-containing protein [Anaerolineales bacterium]